MTYVMINEDFQVTWEIDSSILPFDLIKWHLDYLVDNELFNEQYKQLHRSWYDSLLEEDTNKFTNMPDLIYINDDDKLGSELEQAIQNEMLDHIVCTLEEHKSFLGDGIPVDRRYYPGCVCFIVEQEIHNFVDNRMTGKGLVCIYDQVQGFEAWIQRDLAKNQDFSIGKWFAEWCAIHMGLEYLWVVAHEQMLEQRWIDTTIR